MDWLDFLAGIVLHQLKEKHPGGVAAGLEELGTRVLQQRDAGEATTLKSVEADAEGIATQTLAEQAAESFENGAVQESGEQSA